MKRREVDTGQISLEGTANGFPWDIRGLFSEHYLKKQLPGSAEWPTDQAVEIAYQKVRDIVSRNKERLSRFANEDQARHTLIDPVLTLLGFHYIPESNLPGSKKTTPDYLLFADEASKESALDMHSQNRYAFSVTLAEAKRYRHPLGGVSKEETPGRFPHQQITDYLREAVDQGSRKPYFNWAILTNGQEWRLYYRNVNSYSYFSFDLESAVNSREHFKYFWALFGASAFVQDGEGLCRLDRVLDQSLRHSAALEEDLRRRVFNLLKMLGEGFYRRDKNKITAEEMPELYSTCLIYMYRLLFILYAEGRGLLPVSLLQVGANREYREQYSLARLKEKVRTARPEDDALVRLYNELDELFVLIDGNEAGMNRRLGVPRYNGGLFDPKTTPRLKDWRVGNYTLSEVIKGLMYSYLQAGEGETLEVSFEEAIDYSELQVRQLGSIYEGLLEHHFELSAHGELTLVDESDKKTTQAEGSSKRKKTGSYYTPDYIVHFILNRTLQPLINEMMALPKVKRSVQLGVPDNSFAEALLGLKVLDPAMGSGHFLVRATEKLAEEIASHPTTIRVVPSDEHAEIAYWRRRVVESCIYGVDLNPLAVELAKLSLWLTCISSSAPLSFIDHHIKPGNSLVGSNVSELDHLRRAGEDTAPLLTVTGLDEARAEAMEYLSLIRTMPSDSLKDVKDKQTTWEQEIKARVAPFMAVAHLRSAFDLGLKLENQEYSHLAEEVIWDPIKLPSEVALMRQDSSFFHWELEFPEVFPKSGIRGFDAVVGNPPYVRHEEISDLKGYLAQRYQTYAGSADLYTYFIERSLNLLRPGGRFGFIVSNKWMRADYGEELRKFVSNYQIELLADFGELSVFENTTTYPLVMIMQNGVRSASPQYAQLQVLIKHPDQLEAAVRAQSFPLVDSALNPGGYTLVREVAQTVLDNISEAGKPLRSMNNVSIRRGILTGFNKAFIIDKRKRAELIKAELASANIIVPFAKGDDVRNTALNPEIDT